MITEKQLAEARAKILERAIAYVEEVNKIRDALDSIFKSLEDRDFRRIIDNCSPSFFIYGKLKTVLKEDYYIDNGCLLRFDKFIPSAFPIPNWEVTCDHIHSVLDAVEYAHRLSDIEKTISRYKKDVLPAIVAIANETIEFLDRKKNEADAEFLSIFGNHAENNESNHWELIYK